jgi:tRNA-2-methylthio-N6-dimethylallyladenosine synthase
VVDEVTRHVAGGAREITLLGQIVNAYRHGEDDFADLLRAVDRVDGLRRVRFTSPHPFEMTDRTIEAMAECGTVCEFLHLPVQSGSDRILKRMGRLHDRGFYLDLVERCRRAIPDLALSTDLIAGFPGETEADFEQTLSLMAEIRFDSAFMFAYSPRDGTGAPRLPDPVPEEARLERLERMIRVQNRITEDSLRKQVGARASVLFEGPSRKDPTLSIGRTRHNVRLVADADRVETGRETEVEVVSLRGRTLVGRPVTGARELSRSRGGSRAA